MNKIVLQVRDKDNVHLLSVLFEYSSQRDVEESLTHGITHLMGRGVMTVEHNSLDWKLNGVSIQKQAGHNPNTERTEHYYKTGN